MVSLKVFRILILVQKLILFFSKFMNLKNERKLLRNNKIERKLSIDHILKIKMNDFYINEFLF